MPSCPAPFCLSRVRPFIDEKAVNIHLSKSKPCASWLRANMTPFHSSFPPLSGPFPPIPSENDHYESDDFTFQMEDVEYNPQSNCQTSRPSISSPEPDPPPPTTSRYFMRPFHTTGRTFGTGKTPFQEAKEHAVDPENLTYPFARIEEWGLVYWLGRAGLSQAKIDAFCRLDWVNAQGECSPSFRNAKDLLNRIESLPGAPRWYFQWVTLPEAPHDPQLLLYRDPVECLAWLEANSEFSNEKDYLPYKEYMDETCTERVYCEIASGRQWNNWQREYPEGITILPYILASDSTHLTNFSGDKKIKPVIISNGHLRQHVRAAPSRRAFLCLAYFPEAKFSHIQYTSVGQAQRLPGYLRSCLYHQCMKIVLTNLRAYTHTPRTMVDSEGFIHKEILRLVAYIGDLPEQGLIACLTPNTCVACKARTAQLGNPEACERRTAASILQDIHAVRTSVGIHNPEVSILEDTYTFAEACRKIGLNGVEEPWWADFEGLDICQAMGPDILHGLHKAFKDHHTTWISNLIGKEELDTAFMQQPKTVGFRHFSIGLSKLSQFSGREHRDMQRYMLAAIADHSNMPRLALRATRAELDFIYTAQYNAHTTSTLDQLNRYNQVFHSVKDIFIRTGARRGKAGTIEHFNIPKLHTRHHYPEFIEYIGGAANFATEAPERYHRDLAKEPFEATSAHEFPKQMVRFLDRQEKLIFFDRYLAWRLGYSHTQENDDHDESDEEHAIMDEVRIETTVYEPRLSKKPHLSKQDISGILNRHKIDPIAFVGAVQRYEAAIDLAARGQHSRGRGWVIEATESLPTHYNLVDVWTLFRVQMPLVDELHDLPETWLIHAHPATGTKPANFDVVFVDKNPEGTDTQVGIRDFFIGQLRLIFRPLNSNAALHNHPTERYALKHLGFIEWFDRGSLDPDAQMYSVKKARQADGKRKCDIIELDWIVQPCPLAPRYRESLTVMKNLNIQPHDCVEVLEEFWINCFFSKSTYQTVF